MPYKSIKQRNFFHSAGAKKSGIKPSMVQKFDQESTSPQVPQVAPKHAKPQGIKSRLRKPQVKGF